ncbi:hypothetical protein [Kitasatospora sp. NPDC001095]
MPAPEGHVARAYGLRGDAVVLVRPDGYVALTGATSDLATVAAQPAGYAPVD